MIFIFEISFGQTIEIYFQHTWSYGHRLNYTMSTGSFHFKSYVVLSQIHIACRLII